MEMVTYRIMDQRSIFVPVGVPSNVHKYIPQSTQYTSAETVPATGYQNKYLDSIRVTDEFL